MSGKPQDSLKRKKVPTPDQRRAQREVAVLSEAWNTLQDDERQAWGEKARTTRRGGRTARRRRRSGRRLFFKANFHRLALGEKLLRHPNAAGEYYPMPIVELVITNHAGRISLKLRLSGGPAEGVMVCSWHPLNAGVMVWRKFVRIGPLPPPKRGMSDITRQYVEKYGVPHAGKKVFVRIQQMRDTLGKLFQITSAIVPGEEKWDDGPKPSIPYRNHIQTVYKP